MNLRPQHRECPRFINLTSLIDVIFNLLIFFMVSTSFNRATEISIDLPTAESGQSLREERTIEVSVDAQGRYYLRGLRSEQNLPYSDPSTLRAALQEAARNYEQSSPANDQQPLLIMLNADGQAPHQAVVTVMDAARQVGLTHLTFVTKQTAKVPARK